MAETKHVKHESFWNTILGLLFGNGERQELRRLAKHLTNKGYRYLKRGQIQPAFASLVYSFYRQTAESREVLNKFSKPETLIYAVLFSAVPDHIRNLLLRVEPNEIRNRAESIPLSELKDEIRTALTTIKDYFSQTNITRVNDAFSTVYSYRAFCMYDFFLLLKYFNGSFKENNFEKEPKFSSTSGFTIAGLVADLETAIRFFMVASDWDVLRKFFVSIDCPDVISRDDHGVLYQRATHLENDKVLLSMCKIIKQNINYEINQAIIPPGKIEQMLNKIFHDADTTIKEIYQTQKKEKIEALTSVLFNSESELMLDNYTPKISEQLAARKFGHFEYAEPLGYLHAFLEENTSNSLKKFADTLTIKGKSTMPNFMKDFFKMAEEINELSEGIAKLDLKASSTSPSGYRIAQAAKSTGGEYVDTAHISRDIEILNGDAAILMRKAQNILPLFKDIISKLASDSEKRHGEIIENWNEINTMNEGSAHDYLVPLSEKADKISMLLSIFSYQS